MKEALSISVTNSDSYLPLKSYFAAFLSYIYDAPEWTITPPVIFVWHNGIVVTHNMTSLNSAWYGHAALEALSKLKCFEGKKW